MDVDKHISNAKFDKTEEMFMNFKSNPDVDPELRSLISKTQKGEEILTQSPRNWGKIANVVLGAKGDRVMRNLRNKIDKHYDKLASEEDEQTTIKRAFSEIGSGL